MPGSSSRTSLVEEGRETLGLIEEVCGDGLFIEGDASTSVDARRIVQTAVEEYGRLDCAYNHVGIEGVRTQTAQGTELLADLKGAWLPMQHEIPQMLEQGGGAIVNTASVGDVVGFSSLRALCACEAEMTLLTMAAALEYAEEGIRVNAVCPGFIRTTTIDDLGDPVGWRGLPEEIAEAVVWLCSDAASFVTGHMLAVYGRSSSDGGAARETSFYKVR